VLINISSSLVNYISFDIVIDSFFLLLFLIQEILSRSPGIDRGNKIEELPEEQKILTNQFV